MLGAHNLKASINGSTSMGFVQDKASVFVTGGRIHGKVGDLDIFQQWGQMLAKSSELEG